MQVEAEKMKTWLSTTTLSAEDQEKVVKAAEAGGHFETLRIARDPTTYHINAQPRDVSHTAATGPGS